MPSRPSLPRALVLTACIALVAVAAGGNARAAVPATFTTFASPPGFGDSAGEPSIGVNWATGNVMFLALTQALRVNNFNDSNGAATWKKVSPRLSILGTGDPILYTDRHTHRTFVSQLQIDCSTMSYTDNDGDLWVENPFGCGAGYYPDHQSVGGGPFAAPLTGGTPAYANSVYYCAQGDLEASCALSLNGGLTFNPAVPIYFGECIALHGHIRVAPDGTAYVPNFDCDGGRQAVVVSADNGVHWTVRTIPGSGTQDESDPSVGIGAGGTLYFGFEDGDGHARIAVSHDKGVTWTTPFDAGAAFGIKNSQFPEVIAGDDDRAAFAFLGTPTGGNDQSSSFTGVWHLYVATTYDGGATWSTVDATPTDPVQRGCIWLQGGDSPCRNLLDFNDISVDRFGRVYVAYADGCTGSCVTGGPNTHTSKATIAKQSGGDPLFATPQSP